MIEKGELLELLESSQALRTGHFKLSSGLHSDTYIQCAAVLQHPHLAQRLGEALAELVDALGATAVVSPAMGGVIIGHEVARALGVRHIFVERTDGKFVLRRGFEVAPDERVIVVEDVVTTGKSQMETVAAVAQLGSEAVAIASIVDRTVEKPPFSVPFASLLRVDVSGFSPAQCLMCEQGIALEAPGSRHQSSLRS